MKRIFSNTIVKLLLAVVVGIIPGLLAGDAPIPVVMVVRQVSSEVIFFLIPLIILAFVAPSVASLRGNVSRLILTAFTLAYLSSVGAALFAYGTARVLIPYLNIVPDTEAATELPQALFTLSIPPVMSVMSALLLALLVGLGVAWTGSERLGKLLDDLRNLVLALVGKVLVPLLPVFVCANFWLLAYRGDLSSLGVFFPVLLVVIVCQYIWLALLYGGASIYSGKSGLRVLRHYGQAYLTALGTMSSAATLGVALRCARKSDCLDPKVTEFSIPLLANIHLCGSVLTEVFFVCVVSQILYGTIPPVGVMITFILLLGVFAVGAPGVPGGTVLASLGLIVSVLGFDETGTALLITMFALQDSFGTACNVTGDGAMTLVISTAATRRAAIEARSE